MKDLEDWAAVHRVYKQTHSKRETARIPDISRNTVKKLLEMKEPPAYQRTPAESEYCKESTYTCSIWKTAMESLCEGKTSTDFDLSEYEATTSKYTTTTTKETETTTEENSSEETTLSEEATENASTNEESSINEETAENTPISKETSGTQNSIQTETSENTDTETDSESENSATE